MHVINLNFHHGSVWKPEMQIFSAFSYVPFTFIGIHRFNKKFQRKIINIFLPINLNICFGWSKEPSH